MFETEMGSPALTSYRYGALEVIETKADQPEIARALKSLDPRLFLERQIDFEQQAVWTVQLAIGDQPPVWVLDWRDDDGKPIEALTWRLVDEIKRMMQRGPIDNEAHRKANQALIDARQRDEAERRADNVKEHLKTLDKHGFPMFGRDLVRNHERHREREARLRASDRLIQ